MKLDNKGKLTYIKYGSSGEYKCKHCARILAPPPKEAIYLGVWDWYKDGAGRVRCSQCGNLAERV